MDFTLTPEIADLRDRIAEFVETRILPVEADRGNWDAHDNIGPVALERLRSEARAQGLW